LKTAVVVTTYNRPDALQAVLEGYLVQDASDFELLVADDGSNEITREVVEDYACRARFPMRHVWQEDRGFRAGAARNRAVAQTRAEYILFTDGDCIPPPFFVSRHQTLAEHGCFLAGNRILMNPAFTQTVLTNRIPVHTWSAARWLYAWMRRDVNRALPLLSLPDGAWRRRQSLRWEGVKTCNFSAWAGDLKRVNGFDERYSGWGLEDSDLVIRLLHAGVLHKNARFAAPVFHLWHPENDRTQLPENQRHLNEILASDRVAAVVGLNRYG
jgi:glycosyltransferase involved in cell wall biosynthesis